MERCHHDQGVQLPRVKLEAEELKWFLEEFSHGVFYWLMVIYSQACVKAEGVLTPDSRVILRCLLSSAIAGLGK